MQPQTEPAGPSAAKPYGLVGLVVSTAIILVAAAAILALACAAAFLVVAATRGWEGALQALVDVAPTSGLDRASSDRIDVTVGLLAYIALSLAVLAVAGFRGGARWTELVAWRDWDPRRHWKLFAALLAATLAWSLLAGAVVEHVYPEAKAWITAPKQTPWIVAFLALAVLLGPIGEELLFRGWLYTALRARVGLRAAVLVTSLLFALAHWERTHLYALAVFPVGLALAAIRERTGTIAGSITFHAIYNGVASVLLFTGH